MVCPQAGLGWVEMQALPFTVHHMIAKLGSIIILSTSVIEHSSCTGHSGDDDSDQDVSHWEYRWYVGPENEATESLVNSLSRFLLHQERSHWILTYFLEDYEVRHKA